MHSMCTSESTCSESTCPAWSPWPCITHHVTARAYDEVKMCSSCHMGIHTKKCSRQCLLGERHVARGLLPTQDRVRMQRKIGQRNHTCIESLAQNS